MKYLLFPILVFALIMPLSVKAAVYDEQTACEQLIKRDSIIPAYFREMVKAISADLGELLDGSGFATFTGALGYPGKDMYLEFYYRSQWGSFDKAIEVVADQSGYTSHEVQAIIQGSTFPITNADPRSTKQDVLNQAKEIIDLYNREKALLDFQEAIDADVGSSTLFSNGTTSDSGFDLIVDLNIIEKVLFNTSGTVDSPLVMETKLLAADQETVKPSANRSLEGLLAAVSSDVSADELNPAVCYADDDLAAAIAEFDNANQNDDLADEDGVEDDGDNQDDRDNGDNGDNGNNDDQDQQENGDGDDTDEGRDRDDGDDEDDEDRDDDSGGEEDTPAPGHETIVEREREFIDQEIAAAAADDWSVPNLCGDIFCIQINFVTEQASGYKDEDNCIACHVEKMNDLLNETLANDLAPKKVPGNLLEPNFCKEGVLPINAGLFDVVFLKNPLPAPEKGEENMKQQGSFKKNAQNYVQSRTSFDFMNVTEDELGPAAQSQQIAGVEDELLAAQQRNRTLEGRPIAEIQSRTQGLIDSRKRDLSEAVSEYETVVNLNNQMSYFKEMDIQMSSMLSYFENYFDVLDKITQADDNVCEALKEKNFCK